MNYRLPIIPLVMVVASICFGQEPPDTNYDEAKVSKYELPYPLAGFA